MLTLIATAVPLILGWIGTSIADYYVKAETRRDR